MRKKLTPHAAEEARGLKEIAKLGVIRTPKVFEATSTYILMEEIDTHAETRAFWRDFGTRLARMHRVEFPAFGFPIDNHIGATPQANPLRDDMSWPEYFVEYRLKPMAERVGTVLPPIEFEIDEPASLVHGDLWSGNYLCSDEPVLIDPAPYYGHREVDLAMSQLFGGFAPEFYDAYQAEYPLKPGYERRRTIYNLYHLLNHWHLFGGAYRAQTLVHIAELSK